MRKGKLSAFISSHPIYLHFMKQEKSKRISATNKNNKNIWGWGRCRHIFQHHPLSKEEDKDTYRNNNNNKKYPNVEEEEESDDRRRRRTWFDQSQYFPSPPSDFQSPIHSPPHTPDNKSEYWGLLWWWQWWWWCDVVVVFFLSFRPLCTQNVRGTKSQDIHTHVWLLLWPTSECGGDCRGRVNDWISRKWGGRRREN